MALEAQSDPAFAPLRELMKNGLRGDVHEGNIIVSRVDYYQASPNGALAGALLTAAGALLQANWYHEVFGLPSANVDQAALEEVLMKARLAQGDRPPRDDRG